MMLIAEKLLRLAASMQVLAFEIEDGKIDQTMQRAALHRIQETTAQLLKHSGRRQ